MLGTDAAPMVDGGIEVGECLGEWGEMGFEAGGFGEVGGGDEGLFVEGNAEGVGAAPDENFFAVEGGPLGLFDPLGVGNQGGEGLLIFVDAIGDSGLGLGRGFRRGVMNNGDLQQLEFLEEFVGVLIGKDGEEFVGVVGVPSDGADVAKDGERSAVLAEFVGGEDFEQVTLLGLGHGLGGGGDLSRVGERREKYLGRHGGHAYRGF